MKVKEVFYTIQGEGAQSGRPAVFCRLTGCNLWSGRETDRKSAVCKFCDTDFVGGDDYSEDGLAEKISDTWVGGGEPFVVITGGEPGLQITRSFIQKLRKKGFYAAVESNGTIALPEECVYWKTISPKAGTVIKQTRGNELKVVWPQPLDLDELLKMDFRHFYLQPMDGHPGSLQITIEKVLEDPRWKLSLQTHKMIGVR